MNQKKKVYHCDGFYFEGVCKFRGAEDAADVREDWQLSPRHLCENYGLDDKGRLCKHCVENKQYFRIEPRQLTGHIVSLTPYQAKDSEAKTVKAFSSPKELSEYLKSHPEHYGVNVRTGDMIGVEVC
jgi:hypothetical protein